METISQRLKKKREEMNLSQAQLAKKVGMRQQSLQAIEAGTTARARGITQKWRRKYQRWVCRLFRRRRW